MFGLSTSLSFTLFSTLFELSITASQANNREVHIALLQYYYSTYTTLTTILVIYRLQ